MLLRFSFVIIFATILALFPKEYEALNVLVVGGSGRVGGSTVRWLETLSERRQLQCKQQSSESSPSVLPPEITIAVGGRRREYYNEAVRRDIIPKNTNFVPIDVDGDTILLKQALSSWRESCNGDGSSTPRCMVVHTAGPFQGRHEPVLLRACLELGMPYVDVCDEWELAQRSKMELDVLAKKSGISAVVACGIWPGVSALMAAEAVSQLNNRLAREDGDASIGNKHKCDTIEYSFFTAGTGNAGPTIVSATFLLLATPVLNYVNGILTEKEPWTEQRVVDFGNGVGKKPVWLLDNPDVPTSALSLGFTDNNEDNNNTIVPNVSSRFGTDPLPWNYLFGAMKALPKNILYNRRLMQQFSLFSEPIIRAVDRLVGATNAMRVDAWGGGATKRRCVTLRMAHPDLEQCVGLATAAFALEVAKSSNIYSDAYDNDNGSATRTISPGVKYPAELREQARQNILNIVKEDTFIYEIGRELD